MAYDEDGQTFAGMGIDTADYENKGWPGIFINALANQRYALFENEGGKMFQYVSGASGIAKATMPHSGWGAKFFDFDNDGWKDLFVAQGHVMDNIELTEPASGSPCFCYATKAANLKISPRRLARTSCSRSRRGALHLEI
jgi:hypothetical protein